jgi:hypothetical protein
MGDAANGAVGSVTPGHSIALTGATATASVGTIKTENSVALIGLAGVGAVGNITVLSGDVTVALTGVSGAGLVGNLNAPPPTAPSVSEYLKECWEDTFRPLLGKKPWPFRVR